MVTIVAFSGSLRRGSYNTALLRAAAALAPAGSTIDIASIADFPLYNGDVEKAGMPPQVTALKDRIAEADGLLIATPEYNHSIPGVAKNAIDWMSRPPADASRVFGQKKVGLIGASPGRLGTAMAQSAYLPIFRALDMHPFFTKGMYVAGAGKLFDAAGELSDADTRQRLADWVAAFVEFVAQR